MIQNQFITNFLTFTTPDMDSFNSRHLAADMGWLIKKEESVDVYGINDLLKSIESAAVDLLHCKLPKGERRLKRRPTESQAKCFFFLFVYRGLICTFRQSKKQKDNQSALMSHVYSQSEAWFIFFSHRLTAKVYPWVTDTASVSQMPAPKWDWQPLRISGVFSPLQR